MSLTITRVPNTRNIQPGYKEEIYTILFDSSYPTGGEAISAASFGMRNIVGVQFLGGSAGYVFDFDQANSKIKAYRSAGLTPAGTVAAPVFTGSALTAHRHALHFQTSAAANAVTAASNSLRTAAAAFDVAGVANSSGEGGVVDGTGGTPAGTNDAPAFTGTAVAAAALTEVGSGVSLSTVTVIAKVVGL